MEAVYVDGALLARVFIHAPRGGIMLRIRFIAAVALLFAAACTAQPTTPFAGPDGPRLDGGYGLGSGNKSDSIQTQTNTASTSSGAAAAGGYGLGSGN